MTAVADLVCLWVSVFEPGRECNSHWCRISGGRSILDCENVEGLGDDMESSIARDVSKSNPSLLGLGFGPIERCLVQLRLEYGNVGEDRPGPCGSSNGFICEQMVQLKGKCRYWKPDNGIDRFWSETMRTIRNNALL